MTLSAQDIAAGHQIGTNLLMDTDTMRVWHLHLAPGETMSPHRHHQPYIWTVLTDGTARSHYGAGRIQDITYTNGQTQHFPDLTA
ncbi:hypothetical protein, partial [uncultured Paraglaciecola sp.]|uniref:hypothetical protein n=1 Tax=uncultured Paraglaciecola sp. TaxID=1765024 RepID=UPI002614C154